MVAMPDDVKNIFDNPECDKQKALTWVSTVTEDGDPHLAPVCFVKAVGNDKLLIGVSFISDSIKYQERIPRGCWKRCVSEWLHDKRERRGNRDWKIF